MFRVLQNAPRNLSTLECIRERRYIPFHVNKFVKLRHVRSNKFKYDRKRATKPKTVTERLAVEEAKPVSCTPFRAVKLLNAFVLQPENSDEIFLEVKVGVDLTRQSVRGVCQLPYGVGSKIKLMVFCQDSQADELLSAGADYAGMRLYLDKIAQGWVGFDRCIATAEMMPQVLKLARILGPKGLMPNPKSGTLVTNLLEVYVYIYIYIYIYV
eukprot:GHVL01023570.1.p1 GENE.GHVL01023570.1~~GHVL01023570.1.p1  ORF type:complete len:212 (+),score=29.27 GHVL01023570.1:20-655(+)